jgi:alpha-beta hydrolase superfamily lysophospholipase/quercetin dioxygenase-like cupin family protein
MVLRLARRLLAWVLWTIAVVFASIVVFGAWQARWRIGDLQPWHRVVPADVRAGEVTAGFTLADYLKREDQVFAQVAAEVEARVPPDQQNVASRYHRAPSLRRAMGRDWNRTTELAPEGPPVAGALLVHGLTDAPYSMRSIGEALRGRGVYALALRMPGHGTVPSGLTVASWRDWLAVVRVGARHVRQVIGPGKPLVLVGYSNGGALVTKYAIDVAEGSGDPAPDRLVLLSPMVGISPAARLARPISLLSFLPFFEKARWLEVAQEYNPFKYVSGTANAGFETHRLTQEVQAGVARLERGGRGLLPPILPFHSIVDATVSTQALVQRLYERLPENGSEIVLFDIDRTSGLTPFVNPEDLSLLSRLTDREPRRFARALVTNLAPDSRAAVERRVAAGARTVTETPLGLDWPEDVYSLSHVAIPFPVDDPIYGLDRSPNEFGRRRFGSLSPRGEKAVLTVPADTLMRVMSNPFYPYLERRLLEWVLPPGAAGGPAVTGASPEPTPATGRATAIDAGLMIATDEQVKASEPGPHGGRGTSTVYGYFDQGEARALAFRKRVLHPGSSIGPHPLNPEEEVYYIVSGRGRFTANGKTREVLPGTAILMRRGAVVALEAAGQEDLVVFIAYPRAPK